MEMKVHGIVNHTPGEGRMQMKKPVVGDMFAIETGRGRAYLHFVYRDDEIGEMIRVLPGLYTLEPSLVQLVSSEERYVVFFPISAALKQKLVDFVGHYPADDFRIPRHMRTEHNVRGEFVCWHIVDTETWNRQQADTLNDDQKKLSPWGTWSYSVLIENLNSDWSLEKWA